MPDPLPAGTIVEYTYKGTVELGVVLDGESRKLGLLSSSGQKRLIPARQLNHVADLVLPPPFDTDQSIGRLTGFQKDAQQLMESGELATLWELLIDEQGSYTVDELAQLLFDSADPVAVYATHLLLSADTLYFKQKKEQVEPKPRQLVEDGLAAQRRLQEREREREQFVETVVDILERRSRDKQQVQLSEDVLASPWLTAVRNLCIMGETYAKRSQADEVLEAIAERHPLPGRGPSRAFELLVGLGVFHADENLLLHRFQVPTRFGDEAAAQEQALLASAPRCVWMQGRRDMSGLMVVTIDDEETLDIDDGLSLEILDDGYRVGVHIADPSAWVRPDDPLDLEARRRGVSRYLPDGRHPMFPPALSEGLMSLVAGEPRPAMSFLLTLDHTGDVIDFTLETTVVQVAHRLSYGEVDALLSQRESRRDEGAGREEHNSLADVLERLHHLAEELHTRRSARGAMNLAIPDVKVRVGDGGEIAFDVIETDSPSHRLVSEWMVQAGAAVGRFCHAHGIPSIYRTQPPSADDETQLEDYPAGLVRDFAKRRLLTKGELRTSPEPHAGLGLDHYVQVTSPIRRYADLVMHYQLKAHLRGEPVPFSGEEILALAGSSEVLSSEAAVLERETSRYWTIKYLETHREPLAGVILDWIGGRQDRAATYAEDIGLRVNVNFSRPVTRGERVALSVIRAKARRDQLVMEEASGGVG